MKSDWGPQERYLSTKRVKKSAAEIVSAALEISIMDPNYPGSACVVICNDKNILRHFIVKINKEISCSIFFSQTSYADEQGELLTGE